LPPVKSAPTFPTGTAIEMPMTGLEELRGCQTEHDRHPVQILELEPHMTVDALAQPWLRADDTIRQISLGHVPCFHQRHDGIAQLLGGITRDVRIAPVKANNGHGTHSIPLCHSAISTASEA
jgi:hypothetical protein